jgi:hypothetical protein
MSVIYLMGWPEETQRSAHRAMHFVLLRDDSILNLDSDLSLYQSCGPRNDDHASFLW